MLRKIKGVTLMEIMLALAVIAIILVMATRYFSIARLEQQANTAADQVNMIRAAATRWLESHNDYTNISVPNLQQLNLLPQDFSNPWGGNIAVNSPTANNLEITLQNIDLRGCNLLVNRFTTQTTKAICTGGASNANFVIDFSQ